MQHRLHLKYFGEVLPYLEIEKEEEEKIVVEMPNLEGLTVKEAKEKLKEMQLEYTVDTENTEEIIINQVPKQGIKLNEGTKIILYTN